MAEIPGVPDPTWLCIGNQFLDASASTALTIPAITTGQKGYVEYGAILLAVGIRQWIRLDGNAVTAAVTGGIPLDPGDFIVLRGRKNLDLVRVIRNAAGGSLAISYFSFRGTPN